MTNAFLELFLRDIERLISEVEAFKQEENLWKNVTGVVNTSGNLTLHLIGNLNHFVGAQIGNTGYIRNREAEFTSINIPKSEMLENLKALIPMLSKVISGISEEELKMEHPKEFLGGKKSTEWVLMHLYGHLNYHLGQINYLRRVLEG